MRTLLLLLLAHAALALKCSRSTTRAHMLTVTLDETGKLWLELGEQYMQEHKLSKYPLEVTHDGVIYGLAGNCGEYRYSYKNPLLGESAEMVRTRLRRMHNSQHGNWFGMVSRSIASFDDYKARKQALFLQNELHCCLEARVNVTFTLLEELGSEPIPLDPLPPGDFVSHLLELQYAVVQINEHIGRGLVELAHATAKPWPKYREYFADGLRAKGMEVDAFLGGLARDES